MFYSLMIDQLILSDEHDSEFESEERELTDDEFEELYEDIEELDF